MLTHTFSVFIIISSTLYNLLEVNNKTFFTHTFNWVLHMAFHNAHIQTIDSHSDY